jgi:hypothetical protein
MGQQSRLLYQYRSEEMSRVTLFLAVLLLLAACVRPNTNISGTNEAIIATNHAVETMAVSTVEALVARTTAEARATPTFVPGYVGLRLEISDGMFPLNAIVWLDWPDVARLAIGPTSEVTLQVPANQPLKLTVQAPGYLDWTQALTLTKSLDLTIVMNQGP